MINTEIIDGKSISKKLKDNVKQYVSNIQGRQPCLAVIQIGEDPASSVYVKNKIKACKYTGIKSVSFNLNENVSEYDVEQIIKNLNDNDDVDGILLQLPLPEHLSSEKLLQLIREDKDVDGFHNINAGKVFRNDPESFVPCTPQGIIYLLEESILDMSGMSGVVIGRSNLVGKPVAIKMLEKNMTVTMCHSKTKNLKDEIKRADVVVAAIGKPNFITGDMIKEGAVVIDVGINRTEDGLLGDVDTKSCMGIASKITPVPGGVGPMTIAVLMSNTIKAYKIHENINN